MAVPSIERYGRYELQEALGEGAMGTVYRAWDPELARAVAVKVIDGWQMSAETLERFRREARTLASLPHQNIVTVFDVGTQDGAPFIVMELVDGPTLAQVIADGSVTSFEQKLRTMAGVCDALEAAHRAGIIHRDIKPSNILMGADGRPKLADFGIARSHDSNLTASGGVWGTPAYLAPEVLGGAPPDVRSDMYGLSACLYEWLCGALPHRAEDILALSAQVQSADAPPLSDRWLDCPPSLERCVHRGLARNPVDRFASVGEFASAIRAILGEAPPKTAEPAAPASAPADPSRRAPSVGRRRLRALFLALAGLAAIGFVGWMSAPWLAGTPASNPTSSASPPAARNDDGGSNAPVQPSPEEPKSGADSPAGSDTRQGSTKSARGSTPPGGRMPPAGPTEPGGRSSPDASALDEDEPIVPTLPIGTVVRVRLVGELRTDAATRGHAFHGVLAEPLSSSTGTVADAGAAIDGVVDSVDGGDGRRPPTMELSLAHITLKGEPRVVRSARYRVVAPPSDTGQPFGRLVIAATAGALLGAGVGGREGALNGAALGALAASAPPPAATDFVLTEPLTFRLAAPLFLKPPS